MFLVIGGCGSIGRVASASPGITMTSILVGISLR